MFEARPLRFEVFVAYLSVMNLAVVATVLTVIETVTSVATMVAVVVLLFFLVIDRKWHCRPPFGAHSFASLQGMILCRWRAPKEPRVASRLVAIETDGGIEEQVRV